MKGSWGIFGEVWVLIFDLALFLQFCNCVSEREE